MRTVSQRLVSRNHDKACRRIGHAPSKPDDIDVEKSDDGGPQYSCPAVALLVVRLKIVALLRATPTAPIAAPAFPGINEKASNAVPTRTTASRWSPRFLPIRRNGRNDVDPALRHAQSLPMPVGFFLRMARTLLARVTSSASGNPRDGVDKGQSR
jgi:hypothetical protein